MVFLTNSNWYNMYLLRKINRPLGFFGLDKKILQHTVPYLSHHSQTIIQMHTYKMTFNVKNDFKYDHERILFLVTR